MQMEIVTKRDDLLIRAADWEEPDDRVHRAANTGATIYEEVVTFFLDAPGIAPQPEHSQ
jgi:hypothetical protein